MHKQEQTTGQRYNSAVDWWLGTILIASPVFCIGLGLYFLTFSPKDGIISILAGCFVSGLTAIFLPCYYTLQDEQLEIRAGILKQRISYQSIIDVSLSSCPLSSPALSLKRLKIKHRKGTALISPVNREEFLEILKARIERS